MRKQQIQTLKKTKIEELTKLGVPEKYIRPTIHRYLFSQVRSRFALVDKPEWEIATFLPLADFRKSSTTKVYSDSRKKMNG